MTEAQRKREHPADAKFERSEAKAEKVEVGSEEDAQQQGWESAAQAKQAEALFNAFQEAKTQDTERAAALKAKLEKFLETGEAPIVEADPSGFVPTREDINILDKFAQNMSAEQLQTDIAAREAENSQDPEDKWAIKHLQDKLATKQRVQAAMARRGKATPAMPTGLSEAAPSSGQETQPVVDTELSPAEKGLQTAEDLGIVRSPDAPAPERPTGQEKRDWPWTPTNDDMKRMKDFMRGKNFNFLQREVAQREAEKSDDIEDQWELGLLKRELAKKKERREKKGEPVTPDSETVRYRDTQGETLPPSEIPTEVVSESEKDTAIVGGDETIQLSETDTELFGEGEAPVEVSTEFKKNWDAKIENFTADQIDELIRTSQKALQTAEKYLQMVENGEAAFKDAAAEAEYVAGVKEKIASLKYVIEQANAVKGESLPRTEERAEQMVAESRAEAPAGKEAMPEAKRLDEEGNVITTPDDITPKARVGAKPPRPTKDRAAFLAQERARREANLAAEAEETGVGQYAEEVAEKVAEPAVEAPEAVEADPLAELEPRSTMKLNMTDKLQAAIDQVYGSRPNELPNALKGLMKGQPAEFRFLGTNTNGQYEFLQTDTIKDLEGSDGKETSTYVLRLDADTVREAMQQPGDYLQTYNKAGTRTPLKPAKAA